MKKPLAILRRIGLLLVAAFVLWLVVVTVVLPTREQWAWSRTLSAALSDARSVTITEFKPRYEPSPDGGDIAVDEIVLHRTVATDPQIARLRSATSPTVEFQVMIRLAACFDPHHRVEVTRRDGSSLRFEVCFGCHNFRFDQSPENPLPISWLPRLRQFFTELGMPPRTEAEYAQVTAAEAKN